MTYDLRHAAWASDPDQIAGAPQPHWLQGFQISRNRSALLSLAWLALPLGIVVTLESLATNIPRYFVERELGLYFLGIFAAMAYLKRAGIVVITALGLSASSRLSIHYAAGNKRGFRSLLLRLVGLGGLIGAAGLLLTALFGRQVMTIMYRPEYALYQDVLLVIVAAAAIDFIGTGADYGVTATRHFRQQMVLFAVIIVCMVIASAVLVPAHGLMGAAEALLITAVVRVAGNGLIVWAALRRCPPRQPAEPGGLGGATDGAADQEQSMGKSLNATAD
jgi:O-antigen/teichoic acid export membrane protein